MTARTQDAGLARMTNLLAAASWWLQWGTGTGAAKTANVVTTTTTTEARASAVASQVTSSVTSDTLQLVATLTAAGARLITEVGAFDAAGSSSPPTGGNMDVYGDFGVFTLATSDAITFTIKVTYT